MKKTLSRITVIMLALVMVITSALAVFADAENGQAASEGLTGGASAEALQADGDNGQGTEKTYTIVFDANGGGGAMDPDTVTITDPEGDGESYILPECTFTAPDGKVFDCWKIGDNTFAAGDPVSLPLEATETEVIVSAQWKDAEPEPEKFKVTFTDGYSGKVLKEESVDSGQAATPPPAPSRSGYSFDGWDADYSNITADLTVNAKWKALPHTHSYGGWTTTVNPTYFRTGTKVRRCSCGATESQTIPKLTARKKWVIDGGKKYYFGSNGKPVTGWVKMKPHKSKKVKWCYFTQAGAYVKNISKNTRNKWVKAGGYKFYFTGKRKPAGYGFNFIKNKLYHMNRFGAVMYGTFKASDGNTYTASKSGVISGVAYYKQKYRNFVLIDISDQTLRYYKKGKLKFRTDVVTGTRGVTPTPTGTFKIRSKLRNINLVGPSWNSHVSYWMAFKGSSYGLHDANWRTSQQFSNHRTYISNGSHGCVNMRPSAAATLYGMVKRGTTVIIQQ